MTIVALDLETVPATLDLGPGFATRAQARFAARLAETDGKTSFLKPHDQRIVAAGAAILHPDGCTVIGRAGTDESGLLRGVMDWLADHPTLVGWNTGSFDLPVIRYRVMAHALDAGALYRGDKQWERYDYRYGDCHLDLMDRLAGFGASTPLKLAEAATLVGLPAKAIAEGDDVVDLVDRGDWRMLEAYVANDAATALAIYLRWQLTTGRLRPAHYRRGVLALIVALQGTPADAGLAAALAPWAEALPVPARA